MILQNIVRTVAITLALVSFPVFAFAAATQVTFVSPVNFESFTTATNPPQCRFSTGAGSVGCQLGVLPANITFTLWPLGETLPNATAKATITVSFSDNANGCAGKAVGGVCVTAHTVVNQNWGAADPASAIMQAVTSPSANAVSLPLPNAPSS